MSVEGKKIVKYRRDEGVSFWGSTAYLVAINHPSFAEDTPVKTSRVIYFDDETGRIETLNTIYLPE